MGNVCFEGLDTQGLERLFPGKPTGRPLILVKGVEISVEDGVIDSGNIHVMGLENLKVIPSRDDVRVEVDETINPDRPFKKEFNTPVVAYGVTWRLDETLGSSRDDNLIDVSICLDTVLI